ncbi:Protein O-linked-mannose beta-1,2-N-acetylglucosaminyltransferase 1 [Portunus trituberculatus]|uniref:Protein O-linked-mannose beta-1,2-N-acetylglucosaminyltransferase 1 n=1 Tax=Portunus trituberculatus TaxID=210409 RepID=A0A5B7IT93_PORTR|nr:Protein O-linked-mannose beta-1,2-N-acetylglucosaminyltransferase 1 [Portunus trituberculatus]
MGARDMLIPEVPRTRHMGGGGVHISGFDQVLFSSQPINTLANVTLDVDSASEAEYEARLLQDLQEAEVVPLTRHPCQVTPVPTHKVSIALVHIDYKNDNKK